MLKKVYDVKFDLIEIYFLILRPQWFVISDVCLSCGSSETDVLHPLFEGGLCSKCKVIC